MKVDPFIEAEKVAGRNVAKACNPLEVSKSAYYQCCNGTPSARQLSDAELLEKIKAIHADPKGTYGARASTKCCSIAMWPAGVERKMERPQRESARRPAYWQDMRPLAVTRASHVLPRPALEC